VSRNAKVTAFFRLTGSAIGQTPSASPGTPTPKFDVATIKPAAPGADDGVTLRPGGRFSATNITLKDLIGGAYVMPFFRILGGPPWLDSIHYDIEAKPDTPVKESDRRVMLQALLAERFQLKLHRQTRELPIYALVLARRDGKLGHGITESKEGGCSPSELSPIPEPGKPLKLTCGTVLTAPGEFKAVAAPVNRLAGLSHLFTRLIVDKTGLTGKYDITLQWSPESPATAFQQDASRTAPLPDIAGPSIFAAFQEQLGLKLIPSKGPVEIIVIDHAEEPSEN
jgi:uncharacterized protein (TIGR03435 family)